MSSVESYTPRLLKKYQDTVLASLKDELGLDNVMAVPKLEKIQTVSACLGVVSLG